jgi:hypothetical protein
VDNNQGSDAVTVLVKAKPHWRIVIRPYGNPQPLISNLRDAWRIIEQCSVSVRGWDYPYVGRTTVERGQGNTWIASWTNGGRFTEIWKLFLSGQFVHLRNFWQDIDDSEYTQRAIERARMFGMRGDFRPAGLIDVRDTLYTITEIYEFAARLAQHTKAIGSVNVNIQMVGVRDRLLCPLDSGIGWTNVCIAQQDIIECEKTYTVGDIIGGSKEYARMATDVIYQVFGYMDASLELLVSEQNKLFEKRY